MTLAYGHHFLQDWKREAKSNREVPYIYKYFDVSAFYPPLAYKEEKNPIGRLRNVLVEALNEKYKLPKYVVILQDKEILTTFDAKSGCKKIIRWLYRECYRALETQKDQLLEKSYDPG